MPTTNADEEPVVPLTEEQRYLFDTQGWLLILGLLADDEVAEMQEFFYRLKREPESIAVKQRSPVGRLLQKLIGHPVVVGFANEFVAYPPVANEETYGFRLEQSHLDIRSAGDDRFGPHNGSGLLRFPGDSHTYRMALGRAYAGLICVVWELTPAEAGTGGTLFLSGSHKAAFPPPQSIAEPDSPLTTVASLFLSCRICPLFFGGGHPYRITVD